MILPAHSTEKYKCAWMKKGPRHHCHSTPPQNVAHHRRSEWNAGMRWMWWWARCMLARSCWMQRLKVLPSGPPSGWSGSMVKVYHQGLQLPSWYRSFGQHRFKSAVTGTEPTSLLNQKVTAVIQATPMCHLVLSLALKIGTPIRPPSRLSYWRKGDVVVSWTLYM